MSVAERARQFMPFAALKGYDEMIENAARIAEPRETLTEEKAAALTELIKTVKKGDMISASYYSGDGYVTAAGLVSAVDLTLKYVKIIKTKINFSDIRDVKKLLKTDSFWRANRREEKKYIKAAVWNLPPLRADTPKRIRETPLLPP